MDFGVLHDTDFSLPPNIDPDSARIRAAEIDQLLGFQVAMIEERLLLAARQINPLGTVQTLGHSLHKGNQTWVGLDYQTLQTPYAELWEMIELLGQSPQHVVDLGAGYGRMALVLNKRDPAIQFTGYELVAQRVAEGQRVFNQLGIPAKLLEQDLMASDFELPVADIYFLYDFGKVSHIRNIMDKLSQLADHHCFKVIARGKGSRSLIDFDYPWLIAINHRDQFSIYSMNP
jgi:SAM-dependent methyltransferase